MLRKEIQYVQTVHECLRNGEKESRNKEKSKGASLGAHQSVPYTHPARVSPAPLNSSSLQERPAKWTHKNFQKQTNKKANRGSFLFNIKIPGMKEEGAP